MERKDSPDHPGKTVAQITIRSDWCKGCGFCVDYCPKDVLKLEGNKAIIVDPERCTRCMQCVWICPDFAIQVI